MATGAAVSGSTSIDESSSVPADNAVGTPAGRAIRCHRAHRNYSGLGILLAGTLAITLVLVHWNIAPRPITPHAVNVGF